MGKCFPGHSLNSVDDVLLKSNFEQNKGSFAVLSANSIKKPKNIETLPQNNWLHILTIQNQMTWNQPVLTMHNLFISRVEDSNELIGIICCITRYHSADKKKTNPEW